MLFGYVYNRNYDICFKVYITYIIAHKIGKYTCLTYEHVHEN